jgi:hypothetical protein
LYAQFLFWFYETEEISCFDPDAYLGLAVGKPNINHKGHLIDHTRYLKLLNFVKKRTETHKKRLTDEVVNSISFFRGVKQ